jgi:hypothetical protein
VGGPFSHYAVQIDDFAFARRSLPKPSARLSQLIR